jgi:hypothetical protein
VVKEQQYPEIRGHVFITASISQQGPEQTNEHDNPDSFLHQIINFHNLSSIQYSHEEGQNPGQGCVPLGV